MFGVYDYLDLNLGSACLFQGENLIVNSSFFQGNNGFIGGGFMIKRLSYDSQNIQIQNSIFKSNRAGYGAAIGFFPNIVKILSTIQNNFFYENKATCIRK